MTSADQPNTPDRPNLDPIETVEAKSRPLISRRDVVIGGFGILIASALFGGKSVLEALNPTPHATESPKPAHKPNKATPKPTPGPEQILDSFEASMEKYKNMSVDEFEALPRNERLLYCKFLVDQIMIRPSYENNYGPDTPGEPYAIETVPISPDNNGQEIVDSFTFALQIASLQFVEGEAQPFDPSDAQKMLSFVFDRVGVDEGDPTYLYYKDKLKRQTESGAASGTETATDTSDLKVDIVDGEKVKYKDVTFYSSNAKTFYARFVYRKFTGYDGKSTDYNGNPNAVWLIQVITDIPNNLDNHETL